VSCPTTSYHEHALRDLLAQHAAAHGQPAAQDRWGNLHVAYSRGRRRVRWVLTAHMDHPGFVVVAVRGRQARCRWFGRVDRRYFDGARVVVHTPAGPVRGRVVATRVAGPLKRVRWVSVALSAPVQPGLIGSWDLPAFRRRGSSLHLRAADDLAGCAVLAALLESLATERPNAQVDVVFTRAEEAGLIGAAALARSRQLPAESPIVVIETSKELPGALRGCGPVVRVGDRLSVYDPGLVRVLMRQALKLQQYDRRFAFQRQLMDGGLCEASAFAAHGYRAGGLALPLGNYHNMGPRHIAAEVIDTRDLIGCVRLLEALVTAPYPAHDDLSPVDGRVFAGWLRAGEPILRRSIARPPAVWREPPRSAVRAAEGQRPGSVRGGRR
jgi:putative aminopeptidase FrvX